MHRFLICLLLAGCQSTPHEIRESVLPAEGSSFSFGPTAAHVLQAMGYQQLELVLFEDGAREPTSNGTDCVVHAPAWDGVGMEWAEQVGASIYKCLNGEARHLETAGLPVYTETFWVRPYNGNCPAPWYAGCSNLDIRTVDVQSYFFIYEMGLEFGTPEYEQATAGYLGHEVAHIVYGYFHD